MSIVTSYPGVYIVEKPSGNRTIVGVATSITAFIGVAKQGPAEKPTLVTSFADYERQFGQLTRDSGLGYAVQAFYLNGGSQALITRVVHRRKPPVQGEAADVSAESSARIWTAALGGDQTLRIEALGPGVWANDLNLLVRYPGTTGAASAEEAQEIADAQGVKPEDLFDLLIRRGTGERFDELEVHRNVTLLDGPRRLDRVLDGSLYVRMPTSPDVAPAAVQNRPTAVVLTQGTPGVDGDGPREHDYNRALHSLKLAELVNLVCIPPVLPSGDVSDSVWAAAATACADLRAFLIVDPPTAATSVDTVTTWARTTLGISGDVARNASVYFPRIEQSDPLRGNSSSTFVPCGAVAGTFGRTDASRGVWKAPAGLEAALVGARPAILLTDNDNGRLNPIGVNCIRNFRDTGTVIWGARTRRGADVLADDYKYVPVRRFALFLEETLYRSTQWVVFEPNDEPLWSQIRNSIGAFMQDLFRRQAFQGATPRDAFFVQCGKDTTTQYDIDRGIVNIWVGFAPLKPAEFVVITIQQKVAQPA